MLPLVTEEAVALTTPPEPVWVTVHVRTASGLRCLRCDAELGERGANGAYATYVYEVAGKDGTRVIYENKPTFSNFLSFCDPKAAPEEEFDVAKTLRIYARKGGAAL